MSTRSIIARANKDGSFDSIYCHWDGYPSNNGKLLYEHYQDATKVDQLIALGNLSSLNEEIGIKHPFDKPSRWDDKVAYEEYNNLYGKMCNAYGRDREEKDQSANNHHCIELLGISLKNSWCEWLYIYDDSSNAKWYYMPIPSKGCTTKLKHWLANKQDYMLTPDAYADRE